MGIAHTRWATHGPPTEVNAHPHLDHSGDIALVHNGIIENYRSLRARLEGKGHHFYSETDTEVLAHLIGDSDKGDLFQAVCDALHQVEGTFGIAVLSAREPDRKSSPRAAAARSSSAWARAKPSSPPTPPPSSPTPSG
jgi:glutamine---fructose-6-phosphate transaminase (isomerizing)